MKFSIKDLFSKCDQIRRKLRIRSHLLKKSLMKNFIFCAVVDITEKDIRSIKYCRKSLLFLNDEPWKKKNTASCFDVTMGSLDGAEMCELVGLYILPLLQKRVNKKDNGLYRDNGLVVLRNVNGRTKDLCRNDIISIFKTLGFNIDIQTDFKIVDILDVTLNLENGTYRPFKKPNDKLLYVHTSSNLPPQIIRQIPNSVVERVSKNSSNHEIFKKSKAEYEEALSKSGYYNLLTNISPVLVSYIKYLPVILSKLVTVAHQISNKSSKDTIKSQHQEKNKKQLTVTVEENKNVLCKVNVVQKVLFTNVWQYLTTFHQKHTLAHQKAIGKYVTRTTLNPLET